MKVYAFLLTLVRGSKLAARRKPNDQPFYLWTRDTGEWREITPRVR